MSAKSRFNPRVLRDATRGGVVLGQRRDQVQRVRNVGTERVLPCCWDDCRKDGDTRYRIEVPHEQPRWRDPLTGKQEMLVYIFCSERHKAIYVAMTRQSPNVQAPASP